jgi:hypothetical protein
LPRAANHIAKYRKHRASGQAVVSINGRELYLGPHGAKAGKLAYGRAIAEWLASRRWAPVARLLSVLISPLDGRAINVNGLAVHAAGRKAP